MNSRSTGVLISACMLTSAPRGQPRTHEVGTGRTFVSLQAAVDAARAGDRILVYPGTNPGPLRVTKGVRITCSPRFPWLGPCVFDSIPAGETASLSNADVTMAVPVVAPAVQVVNCAGAVSIERCAINAPMLSMSFCWLSTPPLLTAARSNLVLTNCSWWWDGAYGSPTLDADQSVVSIVDGGPIRASAQQDRCHVGFYYDTGPGGPAVRMTGGLLTLSGTSAQGGWGFGYQSTAAAGILERSGGEIHLAGPGTVSGGAGAIDQYLRGIGNGGAGIDHVGPLFVDQVVIRGGGATPPMLAGPATVGPPRMTAAIPFLHAPPTALPGGVLQFQANARSNTLLYWALNFEAQPAAVPGVHGVLVPRLDPRLFVLGPILVGPAGVATLTVAVPNDPGLRGTTLFAQVAGIDPVAFPLAFFSAAVQGTVGF